MISGPITRALPLPAGPDWTTFAPPVAPRRRPRYSELKPRPHARRPATSATRRPKPMPRAVVAPPLKADEHTLICWAVVALGGLAVAFIASAALSLAGAL